MLTSEGDMALVAVPSRRSVEPAGEGSVKLGGLVAGRPSDCRGLVLRRLLEAYGHVRLDEAVRQLALDALRCGPPDDIRPAECAWLIATLELSGRTVADSALEALADALASRLEEAPESVCDRVARPSPWRPAGG